MIDDDGRIAVIDFSEATILPSSFSRYAVAWRQPQIKRDISHLVVTPTTDGVDNTSALLAATAPMVMSSSSFVTSGRRLLGQELGKDEDDTFYRLLTDGQGRPVMKDKPKSCDSSSDDEGNDILASTGTTVKAREGIHSDSSASHSKDRSGTA